jgi:hypothetical protein
VRPSVSGVHPVHPPCIILIFSQNLVAHPQTLAPTDGVWLGCAGGHGHHFLLLRFDASAYPRLHRSGSTSTHCHTLIGLIGPDQANMSRPPPPPPELDERLTVNVILATGGSMAMAPSAIYSWGPERVNIGLGEEPPTGGATHRGWLFSGSVQARDR